METYTFLPVLNTNSQIPLGPLPTKEIRGPSRWDQPFSNRMTSADVDRLLSIEPFRGMDASRFPAGCSLRDLLANDTRITAYQRGDIVVREGDYGDSAFLVLNGRVRVALESLPGNVLGRSEPSKKNLLRAMTQLAFRSRYPEQRSSAGIQLDSPIGVRKDVKGHRIFLQDVPGVLTTYRSLVLGEGELFGELAALSRTMRTATVFADSECELLEIRWQGLRDLLKRAPEFKQHVDKLYRQNSLLSHLRETPILVGLSQQALAAVSDATRFHSHGDFEWQKSYLASDTLSNADAAVMEPLIAAENAPYDGLILIRSGFARVSRALGDGRQTISYLGKGGVFGAAELLHTQEQPSVVWRYSLSAIGYVDVLRIPRSICQEWILPTWDDALKQTLKQLQPSDRTIRSGAGQSALVEFMMDHRLINGSKALVIDLDRCTRCDDCVRACAATHDGNPRFVRQGPRHGRFQFAEACMHCADPVCLIGCPTGAIARSVSGGEVLINDATCIGCSTCANSCPYSAIRMVEIRDASGALYIDEAKGQAVVKATKCDLCVDQISGPACQQACSHDALIRMDLRDASSLNGFLERAQ